MTITDRVLSSFSSYAHDERRLLPQGRSPGLSGKVQIRAVRARNRNRRNGTVFAEAVASADAESDRRIAGHREVAIADGFHRMTADLATVPAVAEPEALPSGH